MKKPRQLTQEENLNLPIPRLEIRYRKPKKSEDADIVADYGMVYEHLAGEVLFIPMGKTLVSGSHVKSPTFLQLPFREGAHIICDMWHLKLPGFLINGRKVERLEVNSETISGYQYRKMAGQVLTSWKKPKKV